MNRSGIKIIAEAGVNDNRFEKRPFDDRNREKIGADIIKLQTYISENLVSGIAKKALYQMNNTGKEESQLEMLKKFELSKNDHNILINECLDKKIEFLSTAFDLESLDLLIAMGIKTWKIPSGEITNLPYLKKIGLLAQEVILSTGMSNLGEIEAGSKYLDN